MTTKPLGESLTWWLFVVYRLRSSSMDCWQTSVREFPRSLFNGNLPNLLDSMNTNKLNVFFKDGTSFVKGRDMKLTIYFLSDQVHSTPQADRYRDALLNFDKDAWYEQSSGGASFAVKEDGRGRWTLIITPERGHGLSLLATVPGGDDGRPQEFASTTSPSKMSDFLRTGQDVLVPAGSFVTPEQAWWAIEDYLANPRVLSPRLNWTNTSTLSYPRP